MPRKVFDSDSEGEDTLGISKETEDGQEDDLLVHSDSDSAPEDITFDNSKKTALQQIKDAMTQIESDRKKIKSKRKQLDEKYKLQKQQKLEKLKQSRLPDDIISAISSQSPKKKTRTQKTTTTENRTDSTLEDLDNADIEDNDIFAEDFIPLDQEKKGGIQAVSLTEHKPPMTSMEKAAEFREKHLFGTRLKRQSAQSTRLIQHKRRAMQQ